MSETPEHHESDKIPVNDLRKFITRVWEHPLVDDITRNHRADARKRLANHLIGEGFKSDDFATIPVGSLVWTTDAQSDFDYLLLVRNSDLLEKAEGVAHEMFMEPNNMEMHEIIDADFSDKNPRLKAFAPILFTPDDYIGGDRTLTARARLTVIEYLSKPENADKWDKVVRPIFDYGYKFWEADVPAGAAGAFSLISKEEKDGIRNRAFRINEKLDARAGQTHESERYKAAFMRARGKITLPDLAIFQHALTQTQGQLLIDSKYAAKGIQ